LEKLWAKNNKSQWVFVQNLPLKNIKKPKPEGVFSLSLKTYVPLDGDKTIRVWEKNFQNKFVLFDILKGHTASVNSVVFVSSGKILVSGSDDNTMKVWIKKWPGRFFLFDTLTGHTAPVNSVAISLDETTFASGASDNTVKIWKNPFYIYPNAQKTEIKKPLS
jgi:WD40 repeat protein